MNVGFLFYNLNAGHKRKRSEQFWQNAKKTINRQRCHPRIETVEAGTRLSLKTKNAKSQGTQFLI